MNKSYYKYYNILKQNGGLLEGKGTYGIVFSSPRLPIIDEIYEINDNEVSKVFKREKDYYEELDKSVIIEYTFFEDPEFRQFFIQKINHGPINIEAIKAEKELFNKEWWGDPRMSDTAYEQKLNFTGIYPYTIVYEKGINYKNYKQFPLHELFDKMCDFFQVLQLLQYRRLYVPDVKLDNLVIHNDQFKFIDYAELNTYGIILSKYNDMPFIDSLDYFVYAFDYQCLFRFKDFIEGDTYTLIDFIDEAIDVPDSFTFTMFGYLNNILHTDNDVMNITFDVYNEETQSTVSTEIKIKYNSRQSRRKLMQNAFPLFLYDIDKYTELHEHLNRLAKSKLVTLNDLQIYSFGIMLIDLLSLVNKKNSLPKIILQKIIEIVLLCVMHKWENLLIIPDLNKILFEVGQLKKLISEH
jgi:hypothetical protein